MQYVGPTDAPLATVYHYSDGTTVVIIGGASRGTSCYGNELEALFIEEAEFLDERRRTREEIIACATRDSWAHPHRLTVVGRQRRTRRITRSQACNIDERARGPPTQLQLNTSAVAQWERAPGG